MTSLLRRIQDEAVKADADIGALLRQCKILAHRLQHEPLKRWVEHELAGYPADVDVPVYRKIRTQSFGTFISRFQKLDNAPIHSLGPLSDMSDFMTRIEMREGAGGLQELLRNSGGDLRINWPTNVAVLMSHRVYERMECLAAWWMLPRSAVLRIVDNVKNGILNFALEIETQNPDAGEAAPGEVPVPQEKVSQIFNQYFYGGNNQVATGSRDFEQHMKIRMPSSGDRGALLAALREYGVAEDDIQDLELVLDDVPVHQGGSTLPAEVQPWIGRMLAKASDGSWQVGVGVAATIIAQLLAAYFGIPAP